MLKVRNQHILVMRKKAKTGLIYTIVEDIDSEKSVTDYYCESDYVELENTTFEEKVKSILSNYEYKYDSCEEMK